MKRILTIIICTTIMSCGQKGKLKYSDIIGEYFNGTDSTNYNDLLLRTDSTYIGHQSWHWGDNFFEYVGLWKIKDDTIYLYWGNDFTEQLIIDKVRDINSDTLTINVDQLIKKYSRLRFSIDNKDLELKEGKIKIYKKDFWNDRFAQEGQGYEYAPINLDIRIKNGFGTVSYIFTNREITLGFKDNTKLNLEVDSILCRYYKVDSILYSTGEHYLIERNNLIKEKRE